MKVQISVVGIHPRPDIEWPEGWPVPRVDEIVDIGKQSLYVREVVYYPKGDEEGDEPFVYVVVGITRRGG